MQLQLCIHNQIFSPWIVESRGYCGLWPFPWHIGSQVWGRMVLAPCSRQGSASCYPGYDRSRCETSSLKHPENTRASVSIIQSLFHWLKLQYYITLQTDRWFHLHKCKNKGSLWTRIYCAYLGLWSWCCHCDGPLYPVHKWQHSNRRRTSQIAPQSCSAGVKWDQTRTF